MTRHQIRRAIARIKKSLSIDFELAGFEAACDRHDARLILLRLQQYKAAAEFLALAGKPSSEFEKANAEMEAGDDVKQARLLLGEDTPTRWVKDQATLESYALRRDGNLESVNRRYAYGANAYEMLEHIDELEAQHDQRKAEAVKERQLECKKLEQEHGIVFGIIPDWFDGKVNH